MKKCIKYFLLISLLIVSCQADDDVKQLEQYSHLREVGFSANDILSNNFFETIFLEVLYVEGSKPNDESLNNLKSFILERTFKSNITIQTRLIDIQTASSYTTDNIRSIEDDYRTKFSSEKEIAIFILFINGTSSKSAEDSVVLGTSYRNTSFVIFEETLSSFSDNFEPNRILMESTVLRHEFSHLLGLVNLGTPMVEDHQDIENGAHCIVEDCLMFNQIEKSNGRWNFFNQDKIPQLDAFCIEDLKANGGR
ncbi:hypothetical protein BX611_0975 [Lutibacter oceani]|uniref:Membrane metalloprotease n=1 Tax=Lutibacter oceani TaxID=1853311 RepID=A0A3D9S0L7_9FLAO|nr:membrane metalloprotease [Lutibacter oceani]REE83681.1 hypothetical protein BX611_0975 [Lutibacter oceani]